MRLSTETCKREVQFHELEMESLLSKAKEEKDFLLLEKESQFVQTCYGARGKLILEWNDGKHLWRFSRPKENDVKTLFLAFAKGETDLTTFGRWQIVSTNKPRIYDRATAVFVSLAIAGLLVMWRVDNSILERYHFYNAFCSISGMAFLVWTVEAIHTGYASFKGLHASRRDEPFLFYIIVGFLSIMGLLLILVPFWVEKP